VRGREVADAAGMGNANPAENQRKFQSALNPWPGQGLAPFDEREGH
jgi:hypothetical protein